MTLLDGCSRCGNNFHVEVIDGVYYYVCDNSIAPHRFLIDTGVTLYITRDQGKMIVDTLRQRAQVLDWLIRRPDRLLKREDWNGHYLKITMLFDTASEIEQQINAEV